MTIYLASDHAGFALKEVLVRQLKDEGHSVEDLGAPAFEEGDDYPDYVLPCAEAVAAAPGSFGIVLGASGQGEAMAANRVSGVRCAVYYGPASRTQTDALNEEHTLLASVRAHNDANMLSLGARFLDEQEAYEAVSIFLTTPFSGDERHLRRIGKF